MIQEKRRLVRVLVTGKVGVGKSLAVAKAAEALDRLGYTVTGLLNLKRYGPEGVQGIDGIDVKTGDRFLLANFDPDKEAEQGGAKIGPYVFTREGLERASRILDEWEGSDLHLFDEVGPLELRGKGLSASLKWIGEEGPPSMFVVAREKLAENVKRLAPEVEWETVEVTLKNRDKLPKKLARLFK